MIRNETNETNETNIKNNKQLISLNIYRNLDNNKIQVKIFRRPNPSELPQPPSDWLKKLYLN